jgi:uncharacterized protein DUF3854
MGIGLCGVFGAHETTPEGKLVLRKELIEMGVRGRKVYLCFDADAALNPDVRRAEIRLWFMLRAGGAEVFRLTSWDESQGKGIDDFLVKATREDPGLSREKSSLRRWSAGRTRSRATTLSSSWSKPSKSISSSPARPF